MARRDPSFKQNFPSFHRYDSDFAVADPYVDAASTQRFAGVNDASLTFTQRTSIPAECAYNEMDRREHEVPFDKFDLQVLAESPSDHPFQATRGSNQNTFPSHIKSASDNLTWHRSAEPALHNIRQFRGAISYPESGMSSPTISVLQARQRSSHRRRQPGVGQKRELSPLPCTAKPSVNMFPSRKTPDTIEIAQTTPTIQGITLIMTSRLPDRLRSIFSFDLFNAVQSKSFPYAFETDDNFVLSSPTGSGKTVIMELAICRLLSVNKGGGFKVVYQAPTKSLCSERCADWTKKFRALELTCSELTGDTDFTHLKQVQSADIIITTPEKWDSITRKWKDNAKLMHMIKLFLIDEVHILNDPRGSTLEAVVSRMKSVDSSVRFIALSATVPNSDDVAVWLGRNSIMQYLPAHREVFGEEFRPVKLAKTVIGYDVSSGHGVDSRLTKEIPKIIAQYGNKKPVLVFCSTKAAAIKTSAVLADLWKSTNSHMRLWKGPAQSVNVTSHELRDVVAAGVAFHHGGLGYPDRRAVEQGFLDGQINVICSTSTLAVGINLPCYLVIVKGTSCYTDVGIKEYTSLEVMQMLGRAGRPQFETSACAVILTQKNKVLVYEKMVSGQEMLESTLHRNLVEHVNAEVGTGTIRDLESARKWISGTFLSVRLRQNPSHYQIKGGSTSAKDEESLQRLCEESLELLASNQIVSKEGGFCCTEYGDIMARYYVKFETMRGFMSLTSRAKISEILTAIAQSEEFKDVRMKSGERSLYKKINESNDIRFGIKVNVALQAHKVSLLIQSQLGSLTLDKELTSKHAAQMKQDSMMVMGHSKRLIRCVIDITIHRQDAIAAKNALELGRSLSAGVWDNTPLQLKQIEGIGDITARKLAAAGINSIEILNNTESHRIDMILVKQQSFGSGLLQKVATFPSLMITIKESGRKRHENGAEIRVSCEIGFLNKTVPSTFNRKKVYICLLCETSGGNIVDFRRFAAQRLVDTKEIKLTTVIREPTAHIRAHIMCDELSGTHRYAELKLAIPNSWFPMEHTALRTGLGESVCGDHSNEFDDTDLADDDLLAVEEDIKKTKVTAVDDIDDIMADIEADVRPMHTAKRKAVSQPILSGTPTGPADRYEEPKRLANGNWSCQHTCMRDGKTCKHQCCKEGVKKPRKRAKLTTSASQPTTVGSSTNTLEIRARSSTKKQSTLSVDQIVKNSTSLLSSHPGKTPSHRDSSTNHLPSHPNLLVLPNDPIDAVGPSQYRNRVPDIRRNEDPHKQMLSRTKDPVESEKNVVSQSQIASNMSDKVSEFGDIDFSDPDWDFDAISTRARSNEGHTAIQTTLPRDQSITSSHNSKLSMLPWPRDGTAFVDVNQKRLVGSSHKTSIGRSSGKTENFKMAGETGEGVDFDDSDAVPLNHDPPYLEDTDGSTAWSLETLDQLHKNDKSSHEQKSYGDVIGGQCSETDEERKRRTFEEVQREKWSELSPALFEMLGRYVELV